MKTEEIRSKKMQKALKRRQNWTLRYGIIIVSILMFFVLIALEMYLRTKHISILNWFQQNINK